MRYPNLKPKATIGVTAPSSGVYEGLYFLVEQSRERLESRGYRLQIGETVWTQEKAKSAPAARRAAEFMQMMEDDTIDIIIPPWGGELLIEILDQIDFGKFQLKWIFGFSDISVLLLATTLKTGIATAQGANLVDFRGEYFDKTTGMWEPVLQTLAGAAVTQYSSAKYQKTWNYVNPTPWVFNLTQTTEWKAIPNRDVHIKGRLLGGCLDAIRHLVGTPYGDVSTFRKQYTKGEGIIWHFECYNLSPTSLRRTLVQMKYAGWFEDCTGILFGRNADGSAMNTPVDDYHIKDVYTELAAELQIPVVYDIDCGHVPPQMTLINGAVAEVSVKDGKGIIKQTFI